MVKCEEPVCEEIEKKEESSKDKTYPAEKFARTILEILGKYKTDLEKYFFNYLGKKQEELRSLREYFPLYRRSEALYAVFHFLTERAEVTVFTEFGGEHYYPPVFESIEIKRKLFVTVPSQTYAQAKYKETKFIIRVYFEGRAAYFDIYYDPKDTQGIEEMLKDFRNFYTQFSFLKGEKLEFLSRGWMSFLEYPKLDWESVILKEETKTDVLLNLVLPLTNKDFFMQENIPWRRGLLLGGPPGTGKTQICRILLNELDCTIILATTKALYDEDQVRLLFEAARDLAPTLVILEDLDFIGASRDLMRNPVLGELLNQLDGAAPNEGIFLLATSNRPELLDKALANRPCRFDVRLEVNLPELVERKKLLELFSANKTLKGKIDFEKVAVQTEGLTGAHLKEIITYAVLLTLQEKRHGISQEDIEHSLKHIMEKKEPSKLIV